MKLEQMTLERALDYLTHDATVEELKKIFNGLYEVPVQVAFGGHNKGHETIQQRYYAWRKGTARQDIAQFFIDHPKSEQIF